MAAKPFSRLPQATSIQPMERLQYILSKLAQTHPNPIPLTSALEERFNYFVSRYQTPDHPPYSAMIERALAELKDKRGSSEDAISQFIEKTYSSLPLAHSAFLKRHLANLCESGDILATGGKRYMLPGETPTLNLNTNFERTTKRKKCRRAMKRELKKRLKKKRHVRRSKLTDVFEHNREPVEEVEHQVCSKNTLVEQGQTKGLPSCDGEDHFNGDHSVLASEMRSYNHEIGPSETPGGDECTHTPEQQELRQVRYDSPKDLNPEMPPGFELNRGQNLSSIDSEAIIVSSDEDTFETERALRWRRHLTVKSEPKSMTATCAKVEASTKLGFSDSKLVSSLNRQRMIDLTLPSVDQIPCETKQTRSLETGLMEVSQSGMAKIELKGANIYHRRRKRKLEQSESATRDACVEPKQHNVELPSEVSPPNSNQFLNKRKSHNVQQQTPQAQQQEQGDISGQQLRRSSRLRILKHGIAKRENDEDTSDKEPLIRFYRHQPRQPKQKGSDLCTSESQRKRKLKRHCDLRDVDDNSESKSEQLRKLNGSLYCSNFKLMPEDTMADRDSRVVRKGKLKRCGENDEAYKQPDVILALGQGKGRVPVNAASKNKLLGH